MKSARFTSRPLLRGLTLWTPNVSITKPNSPTFYRLSNKTVNFIYSFSKESSLFRQFHSTEILASESVKITYIDSVGNEKTVDAQIGKNLLDIAHDNNIELEGACGGELACATCHLVFEKHIYDILPEKLPEEDDMLDLAMGLTDTSRLGCQIKVTKEMENMRVKIPDDGY